MMNFNNIKRAALLLLAGVSIACSEGPDEMTDGSIPQEYAPIFSAEIINQPADESRAYVDEEDYYVKWEADDRISAFIKESAQQSPYILKTGAGEVTATFKAANTTVNQGDGTQNCAVYPECAGATFNPNIYAISYPMPAVQTYKQGRYAGLEPHLVAHLIDGEQFEFRTFTGYLALKLYTEETTPVLIKSIKLETPSGEPISGTMTISVVKELSGLKKGGQITTGTSSVTLDCGEGVVLSKNQSAPTLFAFALPVNARESDGTGGYVGMKFTVTDTQDRTMVLETKNRVGVARGRISTMAPRTFEPTPVVEAIDLSLVNGDSQPSNCYVVTKPGLYKFPVRFVNFDPIGKYENYQYVNPTFSEIKWMWRTPGITVDDDDLGHYYDEATNVEYIYFTVDEFVEGNMSIVARDNTETDLIILHNWHIWFVDDLDEIEMKGKGSKNYTLLDRNIGAIKSDIGATSTTDPDRLGLLYQWGRKDPMYNNQAGINMKPEVNPYWKYQTSKPSYFEWQAKQINYTWENRNEYPMIFTFVEFYHFYLGQHFNWFNHNEDFSKGPELLNDSIDFLWADNTKTNFDPCPVGYRVPSSTELYDIKDNAATNELETVAGDKIKLPNQKINNFGTHIDEGQGLIWTSTYRDIYGYDEWGPYGEFGAYYYGASNKGVCHRVYGVPVRCIKDKQ